MPPATREPSCQRGARRARTATGHATSWRRMSAPHWMSVPAHYRPTSETGGWIIGGERGHGDGVLMAAARLSELGLCLGVTHDKTRNLCSILHGLGRLEKGGVAWVLRLPGAAQLPSRARLGRGHVPLPGARAQPRPRRPDGPPSALRRPPATQPESHSSLKVCASVQLPTRQEVASTPVLASEPGTSDEPPFPPFPQSQHLRHCMRPCSVCGKKVASSGPPW